jgi:hypothetical protein
MSDKRYPQGMLVACDTPWTEDYQLDETVSRRHVGRMVELGFTACHNSIWRPEAGPRAASGKKRALWERGYALGDLA